MSGEREFLEIDSGGLRLEAVLHLPSIGKGKAPGVVVCHPHPRYGGDMESGVVVGVCEALTGSGFAALRFNFRGVGMSEGSFDWGGGETDDAESAMETLSLRDEVDGSRIGIAGYSFGAAVALQAAMWSGMAQAVASIACPAAHLREFSGMEILQPKLFVLGDSDHDFPEGQFRFLSKRFSDPREYEVIQGADHFFRGREAAVGRMSADFFTKWLKR